MEMFAIVLFVILAFLGWLLILFGLPGTLLILAAAGGYAFFRDFEAGDARVLVILLVLSLFAEILEYAVTYWSGRKAKVPNDVAVVAIIGGIIGALIGVPVALIGSLLGMFAGIVSAGFLYALYKERDRHRAWALAKACLISRTLAIAAKALIGLLMIGYAFWAL